MQWYTSSLSCLKKARIRNTAHAISLNSILYKTKLPFILIFNKTDVQSHDFALEWMSDFEEFQAALASHSGTRDSDGEPTYMNSLMNSMSLVLDEFYKNLKVSRVFYFILTLNDMVIVRLLVCQVWQEMVSRNFLKLLKAHETNMRSKAFFFLALFDLCRQRLCSRIRKSTSSTWRITAGHQRRFHESPIKRSCHRPCSKSS